jgi:predicted membrane chloride channel (bestrophin family)
VELQNPFSKKRLSHLPLNDICDAIQENLLALVDLEPNGEDQPTDRQPVRAKLAV